MALEARPSSALVQQDLADETTTSTSFVKLKEIVITWPGTYRVRFRGGDDGAVGNGQAEIRVNGSKRGATQQSDSRETFTEDIGGLKKNDLLQLYALQAGGNTMHVSDFQVFGSYADVPEPIVAGKVTA